MHHNDSYGSYKCKPKNELGHDEYFVFVERGERPSKPEKFFLQGRGLDILDVNLGTFEEIPDDPMRITLYRFEMMVKDDFIEIGSVWKYQNIRDVPAKANTTYTVSALQPNTTYLMRVASINAAGLSEWTETKEFTTLAYIPKGTNNSAMLNVPFYLLFFIITFHYQYIVCNLLNIHTI